MGKQIVEFLCSEFSNKKNKILIHKIAQINLKNYAKWEKWSIKDHVLCDSIYVKFYKMQDYSDWM